MASSSSARPTRDPRGRTVVVTGATGSIGTALLHRLMTDERVGEVRAVARRLSQEDLGPKVRWFELDVAADDLSAACDGADVVVHLAWRIQPSWDVQAMRTVNVLGSARVFDAAVEAGAAIVHASSVGAYAPGRKDRLVTESWPIAGHPDHPYPQHKAEVELELDRIEARHPETRVVRMRPALVMQAAAGQELRRYFLPRHIPYGAIRTGIVLRLPVRFQVVHADDAADAFARAALTDASGAFNVATEDVIGGRQVSPLAAVARPLASASWRLHAQPVDPGWVTLVFQCPLLDASRVRDELGWRPLHTGAEALDQGLSGIREAPTPPTPALTGEPVAS